MGKSNTSLLSIRPLAFHCVPIHRDRRRYSRAGAFDSCHSNPGRPCLFAGLVYYFSITLRFYPVILLVLTPVSTSFFIYFRCFFFPGRVRLRQCSAGDGPAGFSSTLDFPAFFLLAGRLWSLCSSRPSQRTAEPARDEQPATENTSTLEIAETGPSKVSGTANEFIHVNQSENIVGQGEEKLKF